MAKIVVLEDEASTRALIAGVLKDAGHEVMGVDNGAEGLLVIMAEQPDLVISDIQMPKLSGFEVLAHLRQDPMLAHTPVILLTALSGREHIKLGLQQGADDYITKPFAPALLLQSVRERLAAPSQKAPSFAPTEAFVPVTNSPAFASTQPQGLEFAPLPVTPRSLAQRAPAAAPAVAPTPARTGQRLLADQPEQHSTELASQHHDSAWAMHVCVVNDAAYRAALAPRDWRLLIRNLYSPSGPGAALKTASYVDLSDDHLTAVFVDPPGSGTTARERTANSAARESAAERAARAVSAMSQAASLCERWVGTHFAHLNLPAPRVQVALHMDTAEIVNLPLPTGGSRELVLGPSVDTAAALHKAQPPLAWPICATESAVLAANAGQTTPIFQTQGSAVVNVNGQALRVSAVVPAQR
jgi:DNA-binding response OmpR family regulator